MIQSPPFRGTVPIRRPVARGWCPSLAKGATTADFAAQKCPVHAIDPQDPQNTDQDLCISCMRCVSICPQSARKVNPVMLAAADLMLKKVCTDRKEGELYI